MNKDSQKLNIGIVGLGLIGGSLSAAFHDAGHSVFGYDKDKKTQDFALIAGTIDGALTDTGIGDCDVILLAITLTQAEKWLEERSQLINKNAFVIDCCGVKRAICKVGKELSEERGFSFIGGHPMAGKQVGGFKNSSKDLFKGATFCLVPIDKNDIGILMKAKSILEDAGFTRFIVMTPEEHDKVISFTSQMAHLVSNAYIKSDIAEAEEVAALSGGAFRDMTRVAYLDEAMWTELFMENSDNLLSQLDSFMAELARYREAIENKDIKLLSDLLMDGKIRKQTIEEKKK